MCSVDILNECIDVPECDTIYVTYNCSSKISAIQRMCRAMRIDKNNPNKVANILLYCDEIDDVLTYISAVKELDLNFNEKVNFVACSKTLQKRSVMDNRSNNEKLRYNRILVGIKEYRGMSWMNILEKIKTYITENHKLPSQCDKNNEIKKMGWWIQTTKNNYNKNRWIMKDTEIRKNWEIFIEEHKQYFKSNTTIWHELLEQVKTYIAENNKLPPQYDKNNEIKKLGSWIQNNKQKQLMKDTEIRKNWEIFRKRT